MIQKHPNYIRQLTFPRFILAVIVVVYHFGLELKPFSSPLVSEFFNNGAVCVSFFFFLSGFVMAYNYNENVSFLNYWKKRFARIYPTYLITFLFVFISIYWFGTKEFTIVTVLVNVFAIQSWVVGQAVEFNFPSWSISVEFFFYLTFPFILYIYNKVSKKSFFTWSIVLIILGWIQHILFVEIVWEPNRFFLSQFILYFPLFHFTTFLAGFLCGKLIHYLKKYLSTNPVIRWLPLFGWLSGILLLFLILNTDNIFKTYAHNGMLTPLFGIICLSLALDKSFLSRILGSRPLVFLGNISYGIYMWQFPVFILFTQFLNLEVNTASFFLLYLLLLLFTSSIMYLLIEKKLRSWLSKRILKSGK